MKQLPSLNDFNISRKGLLVAFVPMLLGIMSSVTLVYLIQQAELDVRREQQQREILEQGMSISRTMLESYFMMGTYLMTREPILKQRYKETTSACLADMNSLKNKSKRFGKISKHVAKFYTLFQEFVSLLDKATEIGVRQDSEDFLLLLQMRSRLLELYSDMSKCIHDTRQAMGVSDRRESANSRKRIISLLCASVVANIAVSLVTAVLLSRQVSGRIGVLVADTKRFSKGVPLAHEIRGRDEIADLHRAFRNMYALLDESHKRERALLDEAVDVICSIDENLNFISASPSCETVSGFTPAELRSLRITDLIPPEEHSIVEANFRRLLHRSVEDMFESKIVCKDGHLVQLLWTVHWSATDQLLFCVAHDITDRKHAEELLRQSEARARMIMERMPAALILVNSAGAIVQVNSTTRFILGYDEGQLIGTQLTSLIAAMRQLEDSSALSLLLQNNEGRIAEADIQKADGTCCRMEFSFDKMVEEGNQFFLAILIDVSERAALEKLRGELIAMIAHDMRTPLTSISAILSALLSGAWGALDHSGQVEVLKAEVESQRLRKLFEDLMALEKYDRRLLDLQLEEVQLVRIIQSSLELIPDQLMKHQNKIIVDLKQDVLCIGDIDRLRQVVFTLVSNSIRSSAPSSNIRISATLADGMVKISIAGTRGNTETPVELGDFQSMYLMDAAEPSSSKIELSICRAIIESHGGSIGVTNTGHHVAFWFTLPFSKTAVHHESV